MMNFTYESQGTNTYLVYKIADDEVVDTMSLGMLTNNKILGFATTVFVQMDTSKYIKYNVSSKISVKQFFQGAVNKKRLVGIFSGIVNGLLAAEEYMIDVNSVVLDVDYIFADVSNCEASLICLPVSKKEAAVNDLMGFFKNIMFSTQFDQTENCDYVAKIINFLNSSPIISLVDFKALLLELTNPSVGTNEVKAPLVQKPKAPEPVQQKPVVSVTPVAPVASNQPIPQAAPRPMTPPVPQPMPAQGNRASVPSPVQNAGGAPNVPPNAGEKDISMLSLLAHYSKDNAQLYKAQKAAKKEQKAAASANKKNNKDNKNNKKKGKKEPQAPVMGNQSAVPAFAIPGQPTPAPQPFNQPGAQPMTAPTPAPTLRTAPPTAPTANHMHPGQPSVNPNLQSGSQPAPMAAPTPVPQPAFVPPQMPQGQAMNFGETTVLGGGAIGETTVLNAIQSPGQDVTPYLIRSKNNEKILLNKPVFRIGKEKSYVDYFIGDNTAISRSHANFITRDGEYLVVDTNSTNHTFVNGGMIQSNVETKIAHGDKIRLANEEFEFRLY